jgi:hypothetical protein
LRERLGDVPKDIQRRVAKITDEALLTLLLIRALHVGSWTEFRSALATPPAEGTNGVNEH